MIPAKSTSSRFSTKNFQEVGSMTLVEWAIVQAGQAGFAPIVVGDEGWPDTNSKNWPRGIFEYVCRDKEHSDPEMSSIEIARWAAGRHDMLVVLQPTSPLRAIEDIRGCIRASEVNKENCTSINERTGALNGAVYVRLKGLPYDDKGILYGMPEERSVDINTREDLDKARVAFFNLKSAGVV